MLLACFISNNYPFGKWNLSKFDGFYQYPGFTLHFKNTLLLKNSMFYSFKGLLGHNYYATYAYYIANPTNILCLFTNSTNIFKYYTFIILLRISLCGFTMSKYLKYKYKKADKFTILFSIAYALCGYNVAYFFNYMYFDNVMLLPILMIGLDKLINEKDSTLYIVMLTICIISNFYIGYMECIFSLIYFIYNYILKEKEERKGLIKNFTISSVLSGLMCAFILIPVIYALMQGKADLFGKEFSTNYFEFNLNFINVFYRFTPGSFTRYDISYGYPNIYISLFIIIFIIKFFFNTNISKKEKIATGVVLAFMLLGLSFNLIDYAWQMFQKPIWYQNRYLFTYIFFMISIGYKSLLNKEHIKYKGYINIIIIFGFLLLLLYPFLNASSNRELIRYMSLGLTILLLVQYTTLGHKQAASTLMFIFALTEIVFNTCITIKNLESNDEILYYSYNNNENINFVETVESLEEDNEFYRMETIIDGTYNNGELYNYNGVSMFNSIRNNKIMNLFEYYLGYQVNDQANLIYNFKNPYMNSILSLKYMTNAYEDNTLYEKVGENVYLNKDYLSLGFMVSSDIKNIEFKKGDYDSNIREITNAMSGLYNRNYNELTLANNYTFINAETYINPDSGLLIVKKTNEEEDSYACIQGIATDGMMLIFNEDLRYYVTSESTVNGKSIDSYFYSQNHSLYIKQGESYDIRFKLTSNNVDETIFKVISYKLSQYNEFINIIKENQLNITNYKSDSYLEGTITATKDKSVMFTTIPYDKGWTIYVDGKKVKYDSCLENAFICLDLDEGKHDIKLRYIPYGFILGSIISITSLISIIIIKKKKIIN